MPRTVDFAGATHTFPDSFTDEDVKKALVSYSAKTNPGLNPGLAEANSSPSAAGTFDQSKSGLTRTMEGADAASGASSMWDSLKSLPLKAMNVAHAIRHPIDTAIDASQSKLFHPASAQEAKDNANEILGYINPMAASANSVVQGAGRMLGKAKTEAGQGDYRRAAGYVGAAALPGFGPAAADAGERFKTGDIAGGFGAAGTTLAQAAIPGLLSRAKLTVSPEALGKFAPKAASDALTTVGRDVADQSFTDSSTPKTPLAAGRVSQNAADEAAQRGGGLTNVTRARMEAAAEKPQHTVRMKIGEDTTPGPSPNSINNPTTTTPIYQDIHGPTYLDDLHKAMQPEIDKFDNALGKGERDAMPGLSTIRELQSKPPVVSLSDALDYLKTLNGISFDGVPGGVSPNRVVRDNAMRLAEKAASHLRTAIENSTEAMGSDVRNDLELYRSGMKTKGSALGIKGEIGGLGEKEPVSAAGKLLAPKDQHINLLNSIAQTTPDAIPGVARTTLEQVLDGPVNKLSADKWNQVGKETKSVLYPPDVQSKLDKFFEAASNVPPPEVEQGMVVKMLKNGYLAVRHPGVNMAVALGKKQLARMLMAPDGAELLTHGMKIPINSRLGPIVYQGIVHAMQSLNPEAQMPMSAGNQGQPPPQPQAQPSRQAQTPLPPPMAQVQPLQPQLVTNRYGGR